MGIPFYKYQGTGNDFIVLDNRNTFFDRNDKALVAKMCDRKFGIGADGLMLLEAAKGFDYSMVYYNSDGRESSLCGNGGRCLAAFAKDLGIVKKKALFTAIDGPHEVMIESLNGGHYISLKMIDVSLIEKGDGYLFMNTGSPHYVKKVASIADYDVHQEGKSIRYNERFGPAGGTNVNFAMPEAGGIFVRTYERGVEGETLSCGTGVTACALAASVEGWIQTNNHCAVNTLGGTLEVTFERENETFKNIWLKGPAMFVFKGEYSN